MRNSAYPRSQVITGLDPVIHAVTAQPFGLIEWTRNGMGPMVEPWDDDGEDGIRISRRRTGAVPDPIRDQSPFSSQARLVTE